MGVLDKPLTPCIGICSCTSQGDLICRGCGRTAAEVNDWHRYTDKLKIKIMKRLLYDKLAKAGIDTNVVLVSKQRLKELISLEEKLNAK